MSTSVPSRAANNLAGALAMPLALVASCVVIDVALGQLVQNVLHWPIYLDSVGTILAGALGGPLIGLITGALANVIWGLVFSDPSIVPYAITAACIGVAAGLAARLGAFRNPWRAAVAGLLTGVMSALVSAPISAYLVHGRTGGGSAEVIRYLNDTGASMMQSATLQGFSPTVERNGRWRSSCCIGTVVELGAAQWGRTRAMTPKTSCAIAVSLG
jgi:energy-coupling factor transport system substrate-specific component